jgi:hypothetical protein
MCSLLPTWVPLLQILDTYLNKTDGALKQTRSRMSRLSNLSRDCHRLCMPRLLAALASSCLHSKNDTTQQPSYPALQPIPTNMPNKDVSTFNCW